MIELRRKLDFAKETLHHNSASKLGAQDFDGHHAAFLQVLAEIDSRHPPAANLSLDLIPVGNKIRTDSSIRRCPPRGQPVSLPKRDKSSEQ